VASICLAAMEAICEADSYLLDFVVDAVANVVVVVDTVVAG
jgi:hypothetical protein